MSGYWSYRRRDVKDAEASSEVRQIRTAMFSAQRQLIEQVRGEFECSKQLRSSPLLSCPDEKPQSVRVGQPSSQDNSAGAFFIASLLPKELRNLNMDSDVSDVLTSVRENWKFIDERAAAQNRLHQEIKGLEAEHNFRDERTPLTKTSQGSVHSVATNHEEPELGGDKEVNLLHDNAMTTRSSPVSSYASMSPLPNRSGEHGCAKKSISTLLDRRVRTVRDHERNRRLRLEVEMQNAFELEQDIQRQRNSLLGSSVRDSHHAEDLFGESGNLYPTRGAQNKMFPTSGTYRTRFLTTGIPPDLTKERYSNASTASKKKYINEPLTPDVNEPSNTSHAAPSFLTRCTTRAEDRRRARSALQEQYKTSARQRLAESHARERAQVSDSEIQHRCNVEKEYDLCVLKNTEMLVRSLSAARLQMFRRHRIIKHYGWEPWKKYLTQQYRKEEQARRLNRRNVLVKTLKNLRIFTCTQKKMTFAKHVARCIAFRRLITNVWLSSLMKTWKSMICDRHRVYRLSDYKYRKLVLLTCFARWQNRVDRTVVERHQRARELMQLALMRDRLLCLRKNLRFWHRKCVHIEEERLRRVCRGRLLSAITAVGCSTDLQLLMSS